jgi:environmental stress-induced protein Ves
MLRVHLDDCAPAPWRNGGGVTREFLRWPPSAAADDWRLRLSVAEIERDGPFSAFPGIERWFAVLQGGGVQLALPGGERTLAAGAPPLQFSGGDAPGCRLLAGPTRDLNLMHRPTPRGKQQVEMHRLHAGARIGATQAPAWRAIYAHTPLRLATPTGLHLLAAGTLAWSDDAQAGEWRAVDDALAYGMTLR